MNFDWFHATQVEESDNHALFFERKRRHFSIKNTAATRPRHKHSTGSTVLPLGLAQPKEQPRLLQQLSRFYLLPFPSKKLGYLRTWTPHVMWHLDSSSCNWGFVFDYKVLQAFHHWRIWRWKDSLSHLFSYWCGVMLWTMKYVAYKMHTKGLAVDLLTDNSNSVLNVTSVSTCVLHSYITVCDWIKHFLPHLYGYRLPRHVMYAFIIERDTLFIDAGSVAVDYW